MSDHIGEVGALALSLSAGPCSYCHKPGRGVTFNAPVSSHAAQRGQSGVLARVGVRCGCWDKLLCLIGDCLVCED